MGRRTFELTDEIDKLVYRFQTGDKESGEEILRLFGCHPENERMNSYVGKYYSLLRYGKFDFIDRDLRKFISLYMADANVRSKMRPFYQYRDTKIEGLKTVEHIVSLYKVIDDEELKQELRFLLLRQAKRYKKISSKITFAGYLYNSYRYAVKNHMDKLLKPKEPYLHIPQRLIRMAEDVYEDDRTGIHLDQRSFVDTPTLLLDDELGNAWVRGITCDDLFMELTPLQRLILKLHYFDGLSDPKIANQLGIHINTIFRQRSKAVKLIKAKMGSTERG